MLSITSIPIVHKCSRCGNKLILVKKKKQKVEGYTNPVVVSTYKCTDKVCQDRIDRELSQLRKEVKEQEAHDIQKGKRVNLRLKKTPKVS